MKHIKLFEQFLNEGKSFEFSFNYNTDADDVEYIQGILHIAGVDAIAEPGIDSEEMVIKAKNAVELRKAKKAIQADGFEVNESVVNEAYKFYDLFFNSHVDHNPECDILEGHLDKDSMITYGIYIKGPKKGTEFMEYYSGSNYKPTSDKRSSSRYFMIDKIPAKYKSMWEDLKKIYQDDYAGSGRASTRNESIVNEAKGYSFTLTYNDAKYIQQVLDDAGVDALAKAGVDDEEVIVRAFDGMGLRRAKQAIQADGFDINESKVNEGINVKDIKVGTILTFKDGETWKVTKTPGISSGKIFAAPYGETKKHYVSIPLEFSIADVEKDVTSIE